MAFVNFDIEGVNDSDEAVAFHLMGGASVEITKALNAQAFYRYLNLNNIELLGSSVDLDSHSVELGIVYTF